MAAREIVNFLIGMGDDLRKQALAAASAVDKLGASAKATANTILNDLGKAAKSQNQNQLLAQFESLSSLLIQVGGGASQLGIALSTGARPAYLLASQVGAVNLALAALPAAGLAAAAGIRAVTNAGEEAVETLTKMGRIDLITQEQLHNLKDYRSTADELTATLAALKAELGSQAAPYATTLAGTATALVEGDRGAWEPLLWSLSAGPFGSLLLDQTIQAGNERAGIAQGDEAARRDFLRRTEIDMRQAEDEEKRRKAAADKANAAWAKADAEREKEANKRIAELKKQRIEEERIREEYLRANEGVLKPYRDAQAELDKIAQDEALDALRASQQRDAEAERQAERALLQNAMDTLRMSQDHDREQARQDEQDTRDLAAYEARAAAARAQSGAAAASAFTGADVGSIVSAAGAGPLGAVFGAVASGDAFGSLEGLFDQVLEIYTDLPEQIGKLAGELVPSLIRAAPEMAAAFTVLGPSVVAELVKAGPELFESVIDALFDLPRAFREAFADMFKLFGEAADEVGVDGQRQRRSQVQSAGDVGSRGGAWIPAAPQGGKSRRARTGGGGIQIGQVVAPNARALVRELRQLQGSYGYGEDIDPAVV